MRRKPQVLFGFLLSITLIAGCALTVPSEELGPPFQEDVLAGLLGSTEEEVRVQLGSPRFAIRAPGVSYLVYEVRAWRSGIAFVPLPAPCPGKCQMDLACSMLEFDSEEQLVKFEVRGGPGSLRLASSGLSNCRGVFFSDEEVAALKEEYGQELKRRATEGDPRAMYEYAQTITRNGYKHLGWYCRAAQHGYEMARFELGRSHHRGLRRFNDNAERAYIWYSLALNLGNEPARRYREELSLLMTPDQIEKAKRLVAEWQPDPESCEVYFREFKD